MSKAPDSDVTGVQIHFLDLRISIWFFFLEIEIRIVEINDKSEPFANRLRVRICTVLVGVAGFEPTASASQTNHEPSNAHFWAFFGRFGAFSLGFLPDFSIVSVRSTAGWGQISGQNRQIKT